MTCYCEQSQAAEINGSSALANFTVMPSSRCAVKWSSGFNVNFQHQTIGFRGFLYLVEVMRLRYGYGRN